MFVCLFLYQQIQKWLYPQVSRRCNNAPCRSNHRSRSLLKHLPTRLHSLPLHQNHWAPLLPSEYNSPASCHLPTCTSPQLLHRLIRSIPRAKNKREGDFRSSDLQTLVLLIAVYSVFTQSGFGSKSPFF